MKTITVELDVETAKSSKNVHQLTDDISELVDEINELNETNQIQKQELLELEQRYKSIPKTALQARRSIKKDMDMLNVAIKENNTALKGFRIEKQQKQKLISDLKTSEKSFAKNTDEIVEFGTSLGEAAGAMILLSGGSEEMTQNLEKGIGVAMGFRGAIKLVRSGVALYNNVIKSSTVLQAANNAINTIAATTFKALGFSVNSTSKAFKGLRAAIITTGVGALVVGIGLLVANFDKLKEAITGVSKAQKDRIDSAEKSLDTADKEYELAQLQINNLKLQGKTEEQIVKFQMKALQTRLNAQINLIKLQEKLNAEQLEGTTSWNESLATTIEWYGKIIGIIPRGIAFAIEFLTGQINDVFAQIQNTKVGRYLFGDEKINIKLETSTKLEAGIEDLSQYLADLIFDPETVKEENDKALDEMRMAVKKMESEMAGLQLSLDKSSKKRKKKKEKDDEDELQKRIELEERQWYLLQQIRNKAREQEILDLQREYDKKQELANGNAELEKALEEKLQQEVSAINEKYRKLDEQAEINAILKKQKLDEDARQKRISAANDDLEMAANAANSIQAIGDAVFAHKMKNLEQGSKEEEEMARKQFKFNKALQLGMAIIDAGKAITASLAQSPIAIGPIPNPAGIASLAFAGITSAAQIATIAAQQFQATGTSAPSTPSPSIGGGGLSSQAPQFNIVGQSGFNQIASALGQQPPVQAYVVAQDVTTAQQLQNNTIQTATF